MEKLENRLKENEDIFQEINDGEFFSEEFEKELNIITKDLEKNEKQETKFSKFDVFFYFTIKKKEFVFQIKSDLFDLDKQYTYELIQNIVKKINEKKITINLDNIKYILSLKDIEYNEGKNNKDFYIKNYEFKQCNKDNFVPIKDREAFSSKSLLKNIDSKKISFMAKNPLNIMLREKIETKLEEGDNKYQNYYDDEKSKKYI